MLNLIDSAVAFKKFCARPNKYGDLETFRFFPTGKYVSDDAHKDLTIGTSPLNSIKRGAFWRMNAVSFLSFFLVCFSSFLALQWAGPGTVYKTPNPFKIVKK